MKVLLLEQAGATSMKLQLGISKTFGCNVIFKSKLDDARMEIVSNHHDLVAVVCKYELDFTSAYLELKELLENFSFSIPIIGILDYVREDVELGFLENDLESCLEILTPVFKKYLVKNEIKNNQYIPIKASSFLNLKTSHLGCDVFIKIIKKGSVDQFVKRLHSEDRFDLEEVERYISQGLEEFYIPESQYGDFINVLSIELIKAFKNPEYKNIDRFNIESCSYETTVERIKLFGVDDITIKLVDESIASIMHSIENENALSNYLIHLKSNESTFAYYHCYLIALLAEKLSSHFEWNSQKAREKLTYLAFFHDITLWDLELVKIHKMSDVEKLPKDKRDLVLNHAATAAETVEKFKVIPFGLSQLVREHHGVKNGYGFPDNLSSTISPLSMMFVVIEDFAVEFVNLKASHNLEDIKEIFSNLEARYTKLTYLQTLNGLKKIVLGESE